MDLSFSEMLSRSEPEAAPAPVAAGETEATPAVAMRTRPAVGGTGQE